MNASGSVVPSGDAHALSGSEVASSLNVDPTLGLSEAEAAGRLATCGINALPPPKIESLISRIVRELREPMALLLIAAALVSVFLLDELLEGIAIVAIVVLNAVIALAQEASAERALNALKEFETHEARVLRDGRTVAIDAGHLVPGDILFLAEGDLVPADSRLLESNDLTADESSLTGESLPITKDASAEIDAGSPTADRVTMLFSGSLVTHGTARSVVTATGARTELGKIAAGLTGGRPPTPLQSELAVLTKRLATIAVAGAAFAFAISLARQGLSLDALERTFLAAVALAVAAVPEGLATVVTVALALGVRRMAGRGAIMRRLPAIETLGATTVIATDKTGTLTRGSFDVVEVELFGSEDVARQICALCSDASLDPPLGDPLELSLLRWVGEPEVSRLRNEYEIVARAPFDSDRKLMSVIVRDASGRRRELVKGAPEALLARRSVTDADPHDADVLDRSDRYASRGLKVLALAAREADPPIPAEDDLTLVGLVALGDPVRPEARGAVREATDAGIRLLMVTGDHASTARAIGDQVGLPPGRAIGGVELEREGFPDDPLSVPIYARVTPTQKLDLVDSLHSKREVVAVTGDGVNDAPALHRADIGVAMGMTGTDVSKEAADIVITDDNLATIVAAVREGRGIYDNIRRVVEYLLAANLSEIVVVIVGLLLFPELGAPLLPLQLLWINLVTDGLPAVALGVDPVEDAVMRRPPRRRADGLLTGDRLRTLALRALMLATGALGALTFAHYVWDRSWPHSRTIMFASLALAQLLYALAIRPRRRRSSSPRNAWLLTGVIGGAALQVAVLSWSTTRDLLGGTALALADWVIIGVAACAPALIIRGLRARTD